MAMKFKDFIYKHRDIWIALCIVIVALVAKFFSPTQQPVLNIQPKQSQTKTAPTVIEDNNDDEEETEPEIIPESERVKPEGAIEVTHPKLIVDGSLGSPQKYADDAIKGKDAEAAYANSDGSVTFYFNQAQIDRITKYDQEMLQNLYDHSKKDKVEIEISEDYRSARLIVYPGAKRTVLSTYTLEVPLFASALQVLNTGGKDYTFSFDMVDGETSEVKEHFDQDTYSSWQSDLSWVKESQ